MICLNPKVLSCQERVGGGADNKDKDEFILPMFG